MQEAADRAAAAEERFRRESAARIAELERERAYAFRRLNLISGLAQTAASAENETAAVANVLAALRHRLGWESDSPARSATLERFAMVAQEMFAALVPQPGRAGADVAAALAAFEAWYAENHRTPFWVLFEHYMPETPRVDF
jgi:hypothetical protein